MADVKDALKKQGMADYKFMPGDAIVFRTGWTKYWITDNARKELGVGPVTLRGQDNWEIFLRLCDWTARRAAAP
jgi:kynurenine formamidase